MDGFDHESVQIGKWKSSIPSEICINKDVFNEIFSTETWYKVLMPDQRERILNLLPPEVLSTVGASQQTMEDLLARTLTRFESNPLDTFYQQLEQGRYDPNVVQTKKAFNKAWRKEAIRRRKKYHSKLLQDIIVSREKLLQQKLDFSNSTKGKSFPASSLDNSGKSDGALSSNQGLNNQTSTLPVHTKSQVKNLNSFESIVEKRYREEISAISRQVGCCSSSDDDAPPKKAAKITKKTFTKTVKSKPTKSSAGSSTKVLKTILSEPVVPELPIQPPSNCIPNTSATLPRPAPSQVTLKVPTNPPQVISNPLTSSARVNREEQTAAQMAKFPKILPAPTVNLATLPPNPSPSVSSISSPLPILTSVSTHSSTPLPNHPNHVGALVPSTPMQPEKTIAAMTTVPVNTMTIPLTPSATAVSSAVQFQSNPAKSSPILASQLQSVSPLSTMSNPLNHKPINSQTQSINQNTKLPFKFPSFPSIQNATVKISHSEDDLESSSDDEFEAIEPTIGFSSVPVNSISVSSKATTQKIVNSKSGTSLGSVSTLRNPISKINDNVVGLAKSKSVVATTTVKGTTVGTGSTTIVTTSLPSQPNYSTVRYSAVQLNKFQPQPQQSQQLQQPAVQQQLQQQQQQQQLRFSQQPILQHKVNVVKLIPQQTSTSNNLNTFKNYTGKSVIPNTSIVSSSNAVISTTVVVSSSVQSNLVQTNTSTSIGVPKSSPAPAVVTPVTTVPKMLPITVNLQPATTTNKTINSTLRPLISLTTPTSSALGGVTAAGVSINGPVSVNNIINVHSAGAGSSSGGSVSASATATTIPNRFSVSTHNSVPNSNSTVSVSGTSSCSTTAAGIQILNLLNQRSSSVIDPLGDDLNLNLGLSMNMKYENLEDGEGVGDDEVSSLGQSKFSKLPEKFEIEKIDDLSVLEGNPFDSIPNLSDELDGLDLDLVDGLCDFEGLLSEEKQYASFFSLIRDVLCSTRDHRMTFLCLEKTIRKWAMSPTAALNLWFHRVNDWNEALITALNFLAGNYQDVHPEDFVPYIEYKYKTKYYQWIGAGRDSDNNLTSLCSMWLENVDRLPPLKKLEAENEDQEEEDDENEDSDGPGEEAKKKSKRPQTPPPPRCITDWSVRPSTQAEKDAFQSQERARFENPHKAFTYQMHGYESVVGPVKGVYSSQSGMTNKARGHSLLVDDRPPYVTILALVRDAVARLPNGEGTRSEICEMLRDSAFLAPEASNVTLNSVVSGALDRLHYERDPCVRYDSHKKSWVYLHRDRTQEQFERLHHNRSYTKSTKSRSNTSRKCRKQGTGSKSQSGSPGSTSIKEMTTISPPTATTTITAVVSTTSSTATPTMTLTGTKLPPVGTLIAKTTLNTASPQMIQFTGSNAMPIATQAAAPVNAESAAKPKIPTVATQRQTTVTASNTTATDVVKQIFSVDSSQIVTSSSPIGISVTDRTTTGGIRKLPLNEVLAAASSLGSTIRFATVPNSNSVNVGVTEATGNVSANVSGTEQGGASIVFRTAGNSSLGQTLTNQALACSSGSLVSPQTVAVQVQSVSTSGSSGMQTTSLPGQVKAQGATIAVSQAGTMTGTALNSNQLLLNSSTLIRLASSIRLPEGVRFAQVRLPMQQSVTQPVGSSPVRLPQQRIILTRAALSGQAQTQGVLLGQTPNGQTVILSTTPGALGHLHGTTSSQIPISITTSQGSLDASNITITNSSPQSTVTSHNVASPISVNTFTRPGTISVMTNSQAGNNISVSVANNSGHVNTGGRSHITELPASSIIVNNSNVMTSTVTPTMLPISHQSQPSANILQSVSNTQHIVTQVANHLQQQSTQGGHPGAQLTSPIIIRSQQGDFVIPGHISLGRGMQGIKVIPVPAGKQTVLARIVAPTTQHSQQTLSLSSQAANTPQP